MYRDGSMEFLTRSDRSFVRYDGYKVRPYVMEELIKQNDSVRECVIVPYFDDEKKGLMPVANLVLSDSGQRRDTKELVEDIVFNHIIKNPEISSRMIPKRFRIRGFLPLTKNSKTDIQALIREPVSDGDYVVEYEETNLSIGKIAVRSPG